MRILFAHDKENPMYSETFIKAQLDLLPHDISYICVKSKYDILYNGKPLYNENKFNSITHKIIRRLRKKSFLDEIYKENIKFLKQNKPDIILAQYGDVGSYMVDYSKELDIKLVVHFHGYDSNRKDILVKFDNYKKLFNEANAVIAVSSKMYQQLLNIGVPKEKLYFNCYGIDIQKFQQKKQYLGNQIIAVGRFTDKKAPQITLYAFSKVLHEVKNAQLIMAGDGPLFDVCVKLAKAMKIDHAVTFLGATSHDIVSEQMMQSCIFVQHSLVPENGDTEGTPLAILEAMSTGLPVVSTKHAGIMDVVKNGESGYLVEEMDADSMASFIIELLKDKEKCENFGKKGVEIIHQNYKVERYISDLNNILTNGIKKSSINSSNAQ